MSQEENEKLSQDVPVEGKQQTKNTEESNTPVLTSEEKDIYKQILEKLGISSNQQESQNLPEQSQQPAEERPAKGDIETFVENTLKQDFLKIEALLNAGLINQQQTQNMKKFVIQRAFDMLVKNQRAKQNQTYNPDLENQGKEAAFSEFEKEKPEFFNTESRKDVLNYLKSENVSISKDDLQKISQMIENIEQNAVDKYIEQTDYEKALKNSNELAKQRLTANAQSAGFQDANLSRIFTREQIGKMSATEFVKYEPIIMEQLKKGLIR